MTTDQIEKKLQALEDQVAELAKTRVSQADVLSAAVKQSQLVSGTMAAGDLYYGDGKNNFVRVPLGSEGQVLTATAGVPTYATPTGINTFDSSIILKQIATPANPSANYDKIYPKSDNLLYILTSGGTETRLSPQTSSCYAYQSVSQSITNSTDTAVNLESESWDTDSIHSTSANITRLTIPTGGAGKWLFIGQAQFSSNASGSRAPSLRLNGTTLVAATLGAASPDGVTYYQVSAILNLVATDYIELMAYQTSGGSLTLATGAGMTFLECHRLS